MTQPIKIQLNADALAALFPEGSEARVELQNAVVAEFIRKHPRESSFGPAVKERVERARADALAERLTAWSTLRYAQPYGPRFRQW